MVKLKPIAITKPKEKSTEQEIIKKIELLGGYVIKNQASATTGRGKPDLSACLNGKYYGIEVKRNNSRVKTTKQQILNLFAISKAGGYAYWAKSVNFLNKISDKQKQNTDDAVLDFDINSESDLESLNSILCEPNVDYVELKYFKDIEDLRTYIIVTYHD